MSEQGGGGEEPPAASVISNSTAPRKQVSGSKSNSPKRPNIFVRFIRAVLGYRKTSLSLFVFITFIAIFALTSYDNSLEASISLPSDPLEKILLDDSWYHLQKIGTYKHPYASDGNKFVHDYIEETVKSYIERKDAAYIEYDNDLNNTNSILFKNYYNTISYYESNNVLVRINGSRTDLPALLISAHFDSVPSSYGITDDGVGIASLLGVLDYYTSVEALQPERTIIFNFNNDEEFGLYGAKAFLSHPWSKEVKYFINLEGTGQGGKAILFRGTDYGITKEYSAVRFPYATSIFQQAFNGRVIHSETDYKYYFESAGYRGIDIAFYKPRDIYHTGRDDIRHTSKKAVWHMLSSALDFVTNVASNELDIDQDYLSGEKPKQVFAAFLSFFNFFFIISLPALVAVNIALLVGVPLITIGLLIIIFGYKQNWRLGFINTVKFPLSLVLSIIVVDFVNRAFSLVFEFLPNTEAVNILVTLATIFLFTNYLILNGINFIFKNYKVIQHDEKLIVILQVSFIYWVLLIISTARLAGNKFGNDHTGEGTLTVLYILQSAALIFGLVGWSFKSSKRELEYELIASGAAQPLLVAENEHYGAADAHPSDASSFISVDSYTARKKLSLIQKTFSYDWLIQYLILVPIPTLIIYNNGWLIITGIAKAIQESLNSEELIYKLIEYIAIAVVLPILPFVFKLNRIIVFILIFGAILNTFILFVSSPFNTENPLKLRFIESVNLTTSGTDSYVHVRGRGEIGIEKLLADIPSVKESKQEIISVPVGDGITDYSYISQFTPQFIPDAKDFTEYLSVDILKNSSSTDYPYGLLTGDIEIKSKGSNQCTLKFNTERTKDFPVKTVILYKEKKSNSTASTSAIPEGFSVDKKGNYVFKDLAGITDFDLNKLDAAQSFRVGFQWLPNLLDSYEDSLSNALKVDVTCVWSNLGEDNSLIPSYQELNQFTPLYVSWANLKAGLFSVSTSIEI